MKRRDFLKKCGGIIVAGLSAIPISKQFAKVTSCKMISKTAQKWVTLINKDGSVVYLLLRKIENSWIHYEPQRI